MPDFPSTIFTPRDTENLPGVVYDATEKRNFFSEDFQNLGGEINSIEETLGTDPQGSYATVKAWLTALTSAISGLVLSFLDLDDVPGSYSGAAGKIVSVKVTEDGLEFIDAPSGGGSSPRAVYSFPFMCGNSLLGQFFQKVGTNFDSQNQGLGVSATSSSGDGAALKAFPLALNVGSIFLNSPEFGINFLIGGIGTDMEAFLGIGDLSNGVSTGQDWTIKHVGFKLKRVASGAINVYASQADGSLETSSLLFTVASGYTDYLCLKFKMNASASVDYFYSKNGAAVSGPVNLNTHVPTSGNAPVTFSIGNVSHASASDIWLGSGSISF